MRFSGLPAFCALLLLSHAAVAANVAHESDGICLRVVRQFLVQKYADERGQAVSNVYRDFHAGPGIHPDRAIRNELFKILTVEGADLRIANGLVGRTHEFIETQLKELRKHSTERRRQILSTLKAWKQWSATLKETSSSGQTVEYLDVGGAKVQKDYYEKVLQAQSELRTLGVDAQFVPGMTFDGVGSGKGVLVVKKVRSATESGMDPTLNIFKSSKIRKYLKETMRQGGALVVDPTMDDQLGAYFWKNENIVPKKGWVIGVRPDATWDHFVHEWEHKLDAIDRQNRFPDSVSQRKTNTRQSRIGRAVFEAGVELEGDFLTELNATGREFQLYFESRSFPREKVAGTMIYRAQNQRKVAIGRIFVDPLHPNHYALYLKSWGLFYIGKAVEHPRVLAVVGGAALVFQILMTLESESDDK